MSSTFPTLGLNLASRGSCVTTIETRARVCTQKDIHNHSNLWTGRPGKSHINPEPSTL